MKPLIAYVDDDVSNLYFYQNLLSEGFTVETYSRSLDLLQALEEKSFECFILDIYMPVMDGFKLLDRLRQKPETSRTPVFFVTSNPNDELTISSYSKGADYFDRMIRREELLARLKSRVQWYRETAAAIKVGNLVLDLQGLDCFLNGEKIILTLLEFKILLKIIQARPHKLTKSELVRFIWGDDSVNANNLNSHLYNLRMKLADWDYEIDNHRYQGYWLNHRFSTNSYT